MNNQNSFSSRLRHSPLRCNPNSISLSHASPLFQTGISVFFSPPPILIFCQSLSLVFTALSQSPEPIPSFPRSVSRRLCTFSRPLIVVFLFLPFFFTVSLPDCELERSIVGALIHKTSARGVGRKGKKGERVAMYTGAVSIGGRI